MHAFTFYSGSNRKKKVAVIGTQPVKKKDVSFDDNFYFSETSYKSKAELSEQVEGMIQEMVDDPNSFLWFDDYEEDNY